MKLRWFHILGVMIGFLGVIILINGSQDLVFDIKYIKGYFYAFICALTWSSYSVLSRYFGKVPTSAVGAFCGVTAVLAFFCHMIFEVTVIPDFKSILAMFVLGLGPVGGAFFAWDYGVKKGDITLLGTLSYSAPVLSTILLVAFGLSSANRTIWISCAFIVLGSIISSLPLFMRFFRTHNQPH